MAENIEVRTTQGNSPDVVGVARVVYWGAMIVSLATAIILLWQNGSSRSLALAFGTLAGAMIAFAIQLYFELQPSTSYDYISAEATIDRAKPEIRQWVYSPFDGWRMPAETRASSWLAANNPAAFHEDREKLTTDFVLFSLVSFLAADEFDWQLKKRMYVSKASGTVMTAESVSKDTECEVVTSEDLSRELSRAKNAFAQAPVFVATGRLRLPPKSSLGITHRGLTVKNPLCQLRFTVELSGGMSCSKPKSGGEAPQLPNGDAQFETRWVGLLAETTFFALRAQHRDSTKYREWAARVVNGARDWFEK